MNAAVSNICRSKFRAIETDQQCAGRDAQPRSVLGPIVSFIGVAKDKIIGGLTGFISFAEFTDIEEYQIIGGFTGFIGFTEFTDIVEYLFIAGVTKSEWFSGLKSDLSISDRNLVSEVPKRKIAAPCGHRQQQQHQ